MLWFLLFRWSRHDARTGVDDDSQTQFSGDITPLQAYTNSAASPFVPDVTAIQSQSIYEAETATRPDATLLDSDEPAIVAIVPVSAYTLDDFSQSLPQIGRAHV